MAKIINFLYCESIQQNPNGTLSINGPMQVISPAYIPGMFSFSIFISVGDLELDRVHTMQFKFNRKIGDTSIENIEKALVDTGIMTIPVQTNNIVTNGLMANMELRNVPLEAEGTYETGVWLDGQFINSYIIEVRRGMNVQFKQ